jgi:hypothetical protein
METLYTYTDDDKLVFSMGASLWAGLMKLSLHAPSKGKLTLYTAQLDVDHWKCVAEEARGALQVRTKRLSETTAVGLQLFASFKQYHSPVACIAVV